MNLRAKGFSSLIILLFLYSCRPELYQGNDCYTTKVALPQAEKPHHKNSLEWWYLTGHLEDVSKKHSYGIEYVFFHFNPRNKKDYLMVNYALTDVNNSAFYYDYRLQRQSELLDSSQYIALSINKRKGSFQLSGREGAYAIKAAMSKHEIGMELQTQATKEVLFHDSTGFLSMDGYAKAGYYSYPRLLTEGQLFLQGDTVQVIQICFLNVV